MGREYQKERPSCQQTGERTRSGSEEASMRLHGDCVSPHVLCSILREPPEVPIRLSSRPGQNEGLKAFSKEVSFLAPPQKITPHCVTLINLVGPAPLLYTYIVFPKWFN